MMIATDGDLLWLNLLHIYDDVEEGTLCNKVDFLFGRYIRKAKLDSRTTNMGLFFILKVVEFFKVNDKSLEGYR